jgi:hypothetical protein
MKPFDEEFSDFHKKENNLFQKFFLIVLILFLVVLLILSWYFIPTDVFYGKIDFNTNFSLEGDNTTLQFYPNMRFSSEIISYRIEDCSMQKSNDAVRAFEILQNLTVLSFNPVEKNEEILVTCTDEIRVNEDFFIAGEGGPTRVIKSGIYYVILQGSVLLIKESNCYNPNVAIHEILHVLGFDHSNNKNNIMYNISKCNQEIGEDIIKEINNLYLLGGLPDLAFESVDSSFDSGYLDTQISIRNVGLTDSKSSTLKIIIEDKTVKEIDINPLRIGEGLAFSLKNLRINKRSIDEITFELETSFKELDKENNLLIVKMNKVN